MFCVTYCLLQLNRLKCTKFTVSYADDTLARNGRQQPVSITGIGFCRVCHATWYRFFSGVKNDRTCSIFVPVYGTSFLLRVSGADFWYVCHGYYT